MQLASLIPPAESDRSSAAELLGPDDPLARTLDGLVVVECQIGVALAMLAIAVPAAVGAAPWGLPLILAAAAVGLVLACRAACLTARRDDRVLGLIIRGDGDLPLAVVGRASRRLLDPVHRRRLALALESLMVEAISAPTRPCTARPIGNRCVIAAVRSELAQVASSLVIDGPGLRGVARAHRLILGPASPLYGDDPQQVREELNQIRFLLRAR